MPSLNGARGLFPWLPSILIGLLLCLTPALLWCEALGRYIFKIDDYAYLTSARDPASLKRNLFTPHNTHVVPLFRIQTYLVLRGAGSLAAIPRWFAGASYATLILAMLATGHLLARETGSMAIGLAAMAAVGLSTVLGTSTLWYAASQSTLSGVMILASLICLQAWRSRGWWPWLGLSFLAAALAPFLWSAGYIAGFVNAVYLWFDGRRRCWIAALIMPMSSLGTALLVWLISGRELVRNVTAGDPVLEGWWGRFLKAVHLAAQSSFESLMLGNLGINSTLAVTPGQGVVVCAVVTAAWFADRRSRRRGSEPIRPTPIEAAGLSILLFGSLMVYAGRGSYNFANLRALGWYHSVPQLGLVLFAFGWLASRRRVQAAAVLSPPCATALMSVAILALALLGIQAPRAHRIIFEYDGLVTPSGASDNDLRMPGQASVVEERMARYARQQRFLENLDRVEATCREQGIGRQGFLQAYGKLRIPETPDALTNLGIDDLLQFPSDVKLTDPGRIKELLNPTLGKLPRRAEP